MFGPIFSKTYLTTVISSTDKLAVHLLWLDLESQNHRITHDEAFGYLSNIYEIYTCSFSRLSKGGLSTWSQVR